MFALNLYQRKGKDIITLLFINNLNNNIMSTVNFISENELKSLVIEEVSNNVYQLIYKDAFTVAFININNQSVLLFGVINEGAQIVVNEYRCFKDFNTYGNFTELVSCPVSRFDYINTYLSDGLNSNTRVLFIDRLLVRVKELLF